jgi:hypothetical protein
LGTKNAVKFSLHGVFRYLVELKSVAAAAAVTVTGAFEVFRVGDAAQFDGLVDVLLDAVLKFVHFFLRVEEAGGDGIYQQRVAVGFKRGDFRRFQRLAAVLFFLERLALAHQRLVLAARRGVGLKSVNARADAAGLDLFEDGFAKLVRFRFNFCRHKFCGGNKAYRLQKSNCQGGTATWSAAVSQTSRSNLNAAAADAARTAALRRIANQATAGSLRVTVGKNYYSFFAANHLTPPSKIVKSFATLYANHPTSVD